MSPTTSLAFVLRLAALGVAGPSLYACSGPAVALGSPDFALHRRTAAVLAAERPFVARLSGSTSWNACALPDSGTTRSAIACENHRLVDSRAAQAAHLLRDSETGTGVHGDDGIWAAAILDLAAGASARRVDAVIGQLDALSKRHPEAPAAHNDLAVAYLARYGLRGDTESLLAALDEVERAFERDSTSDVVLFNRGLILERLHLFDQAQLSWMTVLALDSTGGWGREAAAHLERLRIRAIGHPFSPPDAEWLTAVRGDPQGVREFVLDSALVEWADAHKRGDAAAVRRVAGRVSAAGEALAGHSGDSSVLHLSRELVARGAAVAGATTAFVDGSRAFRQGKYADASRRLDVSMRTLASGPLADWARIPLAGVHIFRAEYAAAEAMCGAIQRSAHARGDVALEARAYWVRALSLARQGRTAESLDYYVKAGSLFGRVGERTNQGAMFSQAGDVLFLLGRDESAIEAKVKGLGALELRRAPVNRGGALMTFGRQLGEIGFEYAGLALLREAVLSGNSSVRTSDRAESLLRLVSAEFTSGSRQRGGALLPRARAAAGQVRDTLMHERMEMELSLAEATMLADSNPRAAAARLDSVAGYFRRRNILFSLAPPLTRAATLRLRVQDTVGALRNLDEAVATIEAATLKASDPAGARALSASRRDVYSEQVALRIARHDTVGAFLLAERGRGNRLVRVPSVPVGRVYLSYSMLPGRTVMWILTSGRLRMVEMAVASSSISELSRQLESMTRRGSDSGDMVSRRLYDLLIGPAEAELGRSSALVVVEDGVLSRIPFAGLRAPNGRYLVERIAVSHAAMVGEVNPRRAPSARIVVIGNPAFDNALFPELAPLFGASREVDAVRQAYEQPTVITGPAATKAEVSAAIRSAGVLHFAGHARLVERVPSLSHLVLARRGPALADNSLSASEIERFDLHGLRLVILSSCGTTQARTRRDDTDNGLADAFLNAGAAGVISSRWEADDEGTAELMLRLHRHLAMGSSAAVALQRAQVDLLSASSGFRSPQYWSAFRLDAR